MLHNLFMSFPRSFTYACFVLLYLIITFPTFPLFAVLSYFSLSNCFLVVLLCLCIHAFAYMCDI